jgi:HD-GYP domain-containing protein (c-di-GMP phosphodiesterase class II)
MSTTASRQQLTAFDKRTGSTRTVTDPTNRINGRPAAERARYCDELLAVAVRLLTGTGGAIFAVTSPSRLLLMAACEGGATRLQQMEEAALRTLGLGSAQLLTVDHPKVQPEQSVPSRPSLAVPVVLDGSIVAVVVVLDLDGQPSLEACLERLRQTLTPIALAVDRLRMQTALEGRGEEIAALRRQLDAYAVDFRSTYLAERHSSGELAAALAELEETYKATVNGLAVAVEAKDECTGGHLQRVSRYGMMLTNLVAPEHASDPQFEYGFLLHDIGKLTVPDFVLTKAGSLTESEWELIRQHPESGRSILEGIPFLKGACEIVHAHHERWDGKGYPRGLAREEIPLGAQIFPLCDAFDAMTSDRPYRKALSIEEALGEVRQGAGTQFWPDAVEAFLSLPVGELRVVLDHFGGSST